MRARHNKTGSAVGTFLGLSLLVHVHVVLVVIAVLSLEPEGCTPDALPMQPIEVTVVPTKQTVKPEDLAKEEKKKEKKDRDAKGQVVELPKPIDERRPDKARFLSEYDSKVKQQTRAERSNRPGKIRAQRAPTPRRRASAAARRQAARKLMKLAMRQPKAQPELPKSQLPKSAKGDQAPKRDTVKTPRKPKVRVKVVGKAPKAAKGAKGAPKRIKLSDLKLSAKELAKVVGGGVNDALKDVKKGKHTLLNSKRWRFASFFNRVKRQVAQNWHPNRVYRRRDPRGRIYGFKDRLTVLRVKLTPKGQLKGVHLEKASGVGFLDDEAVRAFRLAQPFPNPPRGLVDAKTGLISFRFGFLFEISRRPSFKIFRYR
jgi:TonB family protein